MPFQVLDATSKEFFKIADILSLLLLDTKQGISSSIFQLEKCYIST